MTSYAKDNEEYRRGAVVVGPETETQEELERAKRGLAPLSRPGAAEVAASFVGEMESVDEVLHPRSRGALGLGGYVETDRGVIWVRGKRKQEEPKRDPLLVETVDDALTTWREWMEATNDTTYGAKGLNCASPLEGYSHEHQVAILVYTTPGFMEAYLWLKAGYAPEAFTNELRRRLPYRSIPRQGSGCTADIPVSSVPPAKKDRLLRGMSHDLRPPGETAA